MIRILKNGFQTTIQGSRRTGFLNLGFPSSGPMDSVSMMGANFMLGNNPFNAALEMYIQGPVIAFDVNVHIAICGANMNPHLNDIPIAQNKVFSISKGDILSFKPTSDGMITYLAFSGEIDIPKYLNSKSTYLPASLGGLEGRSLKIGDIIKLKNILHASEKKIPNIFKYISRQKNQIRVIPGPEYQLFIEENQKLFLNTQYHVSNDSNRMGIRLKAEKSIKTEKSDINSSAIIPGTIQVPNNGLPIVMMFDHQTTGGYMRIANVITHDLDYLAQTIPGNEITFRMISLSKSIELLDKRNNVINKLFEDKDY